MVSPSILDRLNGNNNTSFFLLFEFFDKEVYTFLDSNAGGIKADSGTFIIIPISTPLAKAGFNLTNSSWLKPDILDRLYKVSLGFTS